MDALAAIANHESPHPTADQLSSFAQGRLSEHELSQVAEHLKLCATCLGSVDTAAIDKFVHLVRSVDDPVQRAAASRQQAGYEILELIGRGGMGIVYKARQMGLGRIVALKRMRHEELGNAEDLARFRAEAESMARLAHPNIVQVFEVGEQDGSPFLACEFVAGQGLDHFLRGTPLPPRSAARLVGILARAAHSAHQHSIVHRDLKPSNVLISWPDAPILLDAGEVFWEKAIPKIADFGLAKRLDARDPRTQTDALLGTPEYMAPEQAAGHSRLVGPATDIHALGVILYEALTGRRPFQGSDIGETLNLVREADPMRLRRICPKLSCDLEVICLTCLEKDPLRRYASAAGLAEDLEAWLGGRTIKAQPPTAWERSSKWVRRNVGWAIAALLGLTLVSGSIVGALVHIRRLRIEGIRATAAETRALENVRRGYEAVDRLIQEWGRDAPATPVWRARDVQLKDHALGFLYEALGDADDVDPRAQLTRGMLLAYAGSVQRTLGRFELARRDLMLAAEILEPLCEDPLYGAEARGHQANCRYNLGLTLWSLDQPAQAENQLKQSLALLPSMAVINGDFLQLSRVAMRHEGIGAARLARDQLGRARESYQTVLDLRRQMFALSPGDLSNRLRFADACRTFVLFASRQNDFEECEQLLDEGEATLRLGFKDHPRLEVAKGLARLVASRAVLEVDLGSVDAGIACYDQGIELARLALAEEPNDIETKGWLHSLHRGKAYALCRLGRFPEALPHWDWAISFAEGDLRILSRIERALERAVAGEHRQATDEAAEIFRETDPQVMTWLQAARVFSRALDAAERDSVLDEAERLRAIDEYAKQGVECLARLTAHASGSPVPFPAVSQADIDTDAALAPLRSTDSFRKWRANR